MPVFEGDFWPMMVSQSIDEINVCFIADCTFFTPHCHSAALQKEENAEDDGPVDKKGKKAVAKKAESKAKTAKKLSKVR